MAFSAVLFGCVGLVLGSFGNVLVHRIRTGETITGRSHCPHCKKTLGVLELVPVLSYVALRGRCFGCKTDIAMRYPVIELLSAGVFLLSLALFPNDVLAAYLAGTALFFLLLACAYDYLYQQIPDVFTLLLALVGAVFAGNQHMIPSALLGVAIALVWFGGQWLFTRGKAVGSGDIFLAAALGLFVGFPHIITLIALSYMVGAMTILVLLTLKKTSFSKVRIAFAPFLGVATVLTMLGAGEWYMGLLM